METPKYANKDFVQGGIMIALGSLLIFYILDIAKYGVAVFLVILSAVLVMWGLQLIGVIDLLRRMFRRPKA